MGIRRTFVVTFATGALLLSACSTSSDSGSGDTSGDSAGGTNTSASDIRIDVVTHGAPGDSFWDVVKAGAEQAGSDLGVELKYQSDPDPGGQSTLIDAAVADGTDGLVVSMANPDGLEASIKAAVSAGTPVITINSGIDDWQDFGAITHVGQSETIAGEAAGEQLNEAGVSNVICVIQEPGNVALEERCRAAASTFDGDMENLQTDNTDLSGSQATIESSLQADDSIDGILALGGDMAGRAVAAVESSGSSAVVGTFDLNADVAQNVLDGKLLFAIDQQPYVQGYLGVTGIYLKVLNGNDIGGGQPVYSGPAIITKDNAE
nr:substrate-binding domain-containing protein [Propionibacteriales bacterium]